jgi:hypothetical protein
MIEHQLELPLNLSQTMVEACVDAALAAHGLVVTVSARMGVIRMLCVSFALTYILISWHYVTLTGHFLQASFEHA